MSPPAKEQKPDSRQPRPVDEVIMLRRRGRLLLDDTLDPGDPILRPRRPPRRGPPSVSVHREPIPHQPALALALSAVAAAGYVAWGWGELDEGATGFPFGLARGRRASTPVVGLTSAAFAVTALASATVGRRPGRSRALRRLAVATSALTTVVVVTTLVATVLPLAPT
ncbi:MULTISPECIES: hypothetical protein [unclassified Frigoribacterium]|uniref:hypothetical protein n=1 Tax=unclassified Frigoribacterium TaxID=2627005 RepID=UPI00135A3C82|nr:MULTISPECIES: hypothetical protein [unclassified Frigoribacterium]MBD8485909.1 hypothetical protein [Frigoribacterium sp. CFBP 8759]